MSIIVVGEPPRAVRVNASPVVRAELNQAAGGFRIAGNRLMVSYFPEKRAEGDNGLIDA